MNKIKRFITTQIDRENIIVDSLILLIIIINVVSFFSLLVVLSINLPSETIFINYSAIFCGAFIFVARRYSQPLYKLMISCFFISISPLILLLFFPLNAIILSIIINLIVSFFSITKIMSEKKRPTLSFEILLATIFIHSISLGLSYALTSFNFKINLHDIEIVRVQLIIHALVCACLYIAAHQYYKFDTNYGHLANSQTQPTELIRKKLFRTILLFVFFSLIGTPLIFIFPYDFLWEIVGNIFRLIIYGIQKLFELLDANTDEVVQGFEEVIDPEGLEAKAPFWFLLVQAIFFFFTALLTVIGIIRLLKKVFRHILNFYHKVNPTQKSIKNDFVIDEVNTIERKKRKLSRKKTFGHGEERKIRKAFYHQVILAKRKNTPIKDSDSPSEIKNIINQHHNKDLAMLVEKYEKVRYDSKKHFTDK